MVLSHEKKEKNLKRTQKTEPPRKAGGCLPFLLLTATICILIAMGQNSFKKNLDYFMRGEADIRQFFSDIRASYEKNLTYPDFSYPLGGNITSPFGERLNPLTNQPEIHTGIDIDLNAGNEVKAAADGSILKSGNDERFGNYILLKHNEVFTTCYAHLEEAFKREGESVKKGETIGIAGDTGNTTGKHLHFEIRKLEERMNPLPFLPSK